MATTNGATFSFRLAEELKTEAFEIIKQYGFTPSQVFNLFLTEIATTKTIPVNLSYLNPNVTTLRVMREAENGELETIEFSENENLAEALSKLASKE